MASETETFEVSWNTDMEVNLFHAMRGHKPAGVNRHFQMISIHDRLNSVNKKMSSEDVWSHLSTLYDLQALNESEIVPFPNKSGCFDVLESDVSDLCEKTFPRTPYINTQPTEAVKSDGSAKNITTKPGKPEKPEVKALLQTPKAEGKSENKPVASKSDSRANTPLNKGDQKTSTGSITKSSQQSTTPGSSGPSPKRTKRTRNVPSAGASPATPTEPIAKRRR